MKKFLNDDLFRLVKISALSALPFGICAFSIVFLQPDGLVLFVALVVFLTAFTMFFIGFVSYFIYINQPVILGSIIGIVFTIGVSYYVYSHIAINNNPLHPLFWKTISILGASLTTSMYIGKERLSRWDENIKLFYKNKSTWTKYLSEKLNSFAVILVSVSALFLGIFYVISNFIGLSGNTAGNSLIVFVSLSLLLTVFAPLSSGFFLVIVWLLLLPYHITSRIEKSDVAERTFALLGLLLTILGILLGS